MPPSKIMIGTGFMNVVLVLERDGQLGGPGERSEAGRTSSPHGSRAAGPVGPTMAAAPHSPIARCDVPKASERH
jgi:hypothetical protein